MTIKINYLYMTCHFHIGLRDQYIIKDARVQEMPTCLSPGSSTEPILFYASQVSKPSSVFILPNSEYL